jgi:hypothetical protein
MTTVGHAAPHWDRYSLQAAGRNIPTAYPDNRAAMPPANSGAQYSGADQENARRQAARMSPEERRNLRRQINEAGQDIYTPRR